MKRPQAEEFLRQLQQEPSEGDQAMWTQEVIADMDFESYAFAVILSASKTEAEWRSIVKDPSKFIAKRIAKGIEISWQKLSKEQREAMKEAKEIEIKE